MTSHTGIEHEQAPFTMTLTLPAFLDALDDKLRRHIDGGFVGLGPCELRAMLREALLSIKHPTPALGWSEWLDWAGGPDAECPLPPGTSAQIERPDDGVFDVADAAALAGWDWSVGWKRIKRFRYRTTDHSGWLPRGDFIPPDVLWDKACPVRCEWTCNTDGYCATDHPSKWSGITHIRLLPRKSAAPKLPEGWKIDDDGDLRTRTGWVVLTKRHLHEHDPDTIRRAVDAWLASMKERGNG